MAMKNEKPVIGVYVCHCGMNIASKVDIEAVKNYAQGLENVKIAEEYKFMCSSPGQDLIINDIKKKGLNRVVVASCSPRMHEITFRKACETAGISKFFFQMANIRENSSWVTTDKDEATGKAKELVAAAVARVSHHKDLSTRKVDVTKSVLVIGGGIAGMQAALTAAEAGLKVYIIEREPSIGGHMAKFDKTFPTLDCSACIMTPKMVSVSQHENITVHTWSEVESVTGFVGNFTVRVKKKPRYVDEEKCTGCGVCMEKCPSKKITSEFDEGLTQRTAIFSPFRQAVPRTPVIDAENCLKLGKGKKCGICDKFCEADAIDYDQKPEFIDINTGAVIYATGFKAFDPGPIGQYGYGIYPEVYTSLEFERLNNATGPTSGSILMKNGKPPAKVAIIHCVGSRDKKHNTYCSRVCCMYSMKFAHLLKDKTGAEVWEFYIDVRAPGKLYEEFYNRVQEEGVHLIRGRVAEITDIPDKPEDMGKLTVVAENTLTMRTLRIPVDMVILSVGLEPAEGSENVGKLAGVQTDGDGWFTGIRCSRRSYCPAFKRECGNQGGNIIY